ncbi:MAG: metallophosphoesterase family protein [Lunatimonas sp.]|nr:metallophosphoesterase family protein [Lunatimonas sp.]
MNEAKKKRFWHLNYLLIGCMMLGMSVNAQQALDVDQVEVQLRGYLPSPMPDRVILNLSESPLNVLNVNWRTSVDQTEGVLEWSEATHSSSFFETIRSQQAKSEFLSVRHETNSTIEAYYHSAQMTDLVPGKVYVYRVGAGDHWSEWFQVSIPDPEKEGLSFLYLGDAQNGVRDHWSRLIRQAYKHFPDAAFSIHAGDLINRHNDDFEWGEWFYAGGFIHATVPSMMTPGNHEYGKDELLSPQWRPQFNLPLNGPKGLEETCYQINYPNLKLVSLNAEEIEESPYLKHQQVIWLDSILANDPRKWTVVTIHHPFYSTKANRDNADLRKHFKPIIDKYQVDLVLQGHDHAYGRGMIGPSQHGGIDEVKAEKEGTVYVVSMAGIKMYDAEDYPWMERKASKTQTYQVIHLSNDSKLQFEAYTIHGELYDAFELIKGPDGRNELVNRIPDTPEYE